MRYDVVVVGGGPAGSLTAYRLARAGASVLLIDSKKFPRIKPCGGGLQHRALTHIPFDVGGVCRGTLSDISFSFKLQRRFHRKHAGALVHTVVRSDFDAFLLQQAVTAGAEVLQGVRVLAVNQVASQSEITSTAGRFVARFVVGADGANSIVARSLTPRSSYFWQAAIYSEVSEDEVDRERVQSDTMRIDWGTLPSGYGWVFPKQGFINIGVGCPLNLGKMLRPYLSRFLAHEGILRCGCHTSIVGHQLPTLTERTTIEGKTTILTGDAAGLVDPLTGDGISNACHSAEIAARFIVDKLGSNNDTSYQRLIHEAIGEELQWSRLLLSLAVVFPKLLYNSFQSSERVWSCFCRTLRGESTFRELASAVLGPFGGLRVPIYRALRFCEGRKMAGFCLEDWSQENAPAIEHVPPSRRARADSPN